MPQSCVFMSLHLGNFKYVLHIRTIEATNALVGFIVWICYYCILNNVFRPQKTRKKTRIKLYNTLTLPVLLYGSET